MKNLFLPAKKKLLNINIELLKKRLSESDYKIIKCAECSLSGNDLLYDVEALHTERQAIRDRINALEAELDALEASQ